MFLEYIEAGTARSRMSADFRLFIMNRLAQINALWLSAMREHCPRARQGIGLPMP